MLNFIFSSLLFLAGSLLFLSEGRAEDAFSDAVQRDWVRQEKTAGRTPASPEALKELGSRGAALLKCLKEKEFITSEKAAALQTELERVSQLKVEELSGDEIRKNYFSLRWVMRDAIFSNPLIDGIPIIFLQEDRYVWQLIHEYLSYYYRHTSMKGGELLLLKNPGRSFETASLSAGKLPRGVFSTPSLSWDAKTLFFAFADFSKVVPEDAKQTTLQTIIDRGYDTQLADYLKTDEGKFHLFRMDLETGRVEQLTDGPHDDFDPAQLPDGDLVFVSTRRGGYARCTGNYEPVQTATLHKRLKNGEIRCLSWHETSEWNPSILHDGRILYSRWDYVDREAARFMNLWITNPDGTGAQALFGNHTEKVVASLQAKEIPGSNRILFLGSGHHIAVGGTLAILDPSKVKFDPETSEDSLDCLELLTPDIPFPETLVPGSNGERAYVSDHYFYGPYPLSEDFYLASFSHDPNGGYLAKNSYGYRGTCGESFSSGKMGLYYRDRFGNQELIFEDSEVSCRYPMQCKSRPEPQRLASKLPEDDSAFGTFALANVRESLVPFPENRPVKELRVFQILPQTADYVSNRPPLGFARAANPRLFLGTVPVEADGSAHFQVPACKPLYFQAVDAEGKAIHTMMSEVYLQPGENRGCIGCHEQLHSVVKNVSGKSIALLRPASTLTPPPAGTNPFSYPILVQPILDRACVSCHDDSEKAVEPDLRGIPDGNFSRSYQSLRPWVRWHQWGGETIDRISSLPGRAACEMSPLTGILSNETHRNLPNFTENDRRILYLWMDANVPFYGTGDVELQKRQLRGEAIPVQEIQ